MAPAIADVLSLSRGAAAVPPQGGFRPLPVGYNDGTPMVSDKTLRSWIEQAVGGDLPAVQRLIMVHHARLRPIADQRLAPAMRAKVEPEDILQLVYADAVQHIREFEYRGADSFFHWLQRILESKLVDAHRFFHAAVRDVNREVPAAERPSMYESLAARAAVDSLTPSRIVARHEVDSLVAAALAGLSADYRRVLELRFLKGQSVAEVAGAMGRTPGAIQMLSARALRRLRESLSQLSRVEF